MARIILSSTRAAVPDLQTYRRLQYAENPSSTEWNRGDRHVGPGEWLSNDLDGAFKKVHTKMTGIDASTQHRPRLTDCCFCPMEYEVLVNAKSKVIVEVWREIGSSTDAACHANRTRLGLTTWQSTFD
jgi:hypothetical protein